MNYLFCIIRGCLTLIWPASSNKTTSKYLSIWRCLLLSSTAIPSPPTHKTLSCMYVYMYVRIHISVFPPLHIWWDVCGFLERGGRSRPWLEAAIDLRQWALIGSICPLTFSNAADPFSCWIPEL